MVGHSTCGRDCARFLLSQIAEDSEQIRVTNLMKIIKLLRPFGVSIIAFLLYLIERGYVDDIINRLIIPITNVESSIPLAFITIIFITSVHLNPLTFGFTYRL